MTGKEPADLQGHLKRDGAEPVRLDPVPLAEALREARRNASRCYARAAWAVYMTDPGKLADAATLIEQQSAELARLRAALYEIDRLLPHWDETDPAREAISRALEGGAA